MFFNKKVALLLVLLVGVFSSINGAQKPLKVVSITEDFAAIAHRIGGQYVQTYALVKGSRNLHHVIPKPSMVVHVRSADLLLRLGMSQDSWIDDLIQTARNKDVFPGSKGYIDCSVGIRALEVPMTSIDGSQGDMHLEGNPHYWLNPLNGKIIAKQLLDRLTLLIPDQKAYFEKNYQFFCDQIDQKMVGWTKKFQAMDDTVFVTYHKVWSYFFDAFSLTSLGELEPFPGIPPTTRRLKQLETQMADINKQKIVLITNFYSKRIGKRFAATTGADFLQVPSNLGEGEESTYIGFFDYLVTEITRR